MSWSSKFVKAIDVLLSNTSIIEVNVEKTYFVFNIRLLILVQMDLDELWAIQLNSDPLTHNFDGVNKIFEKGIIYSGKRAAINKNQE